MSSLRFGGHDGFKRRAPEEGEKVFDGKKMRKNMVRKVIDPTSQFMYASAIAPTMRSVLARRYYCQPKPQFSKYMLVPQHYGSTASGFCVTSRFEHMSMNMHRCPIYTAAWSPEGRRMVTGAQTGEFTLWNGMAFNFETILQAHDHPVCTMKWSHSDQWLVSSDDSGGIKYWQANLNEVKQFAGHAEAVRELAFAPTDQKIVTCSDDSTLKLFDFLTATEEQTLTGHGWDVLTVDWHPRSSLIASGSKDNLVKLWEPRSGANVATLSTHKHSISKVSWNRNGNWLLTGSRDCLLKVYDIRTMKEMQSFTGHQKQITALSWHPTAEGVFASGSYKGELFFWDVNSSSPMGKIDQAHDQAIHWLGFHPVGHVLGTVSEDHATKFWVRNRPGDALDDKHHHYGRMSDSLPLAEQERNREHLQAQARSQHYVRRGDDSGRGSYNRQEADGATNARVAVEQARVNAMYAAPRGGGAGRPSATAAPVGYGGRPPMGGVPPQQYQQRPPMQQQQQQQQQYGRPQYGHRPPPHQQQHQEQQYGRQR